MKATGIVRRIDDLGRVVVPKEIRKTLRIREGDPLEIFTDREGEIILKKYSPLGEMSFFAKQYAEALAQGSGYMVSITDKDNHVAVAGNGKKDLAGKPVSKRLEEIMEKRRSVSATSEEKTYVPLIEGEMEPYANEVICPILAEGDVIGAVIIVNRDVRAVMGDVEKKLAYTAAGFLGKQIEH